jgi:hypothetical protein
MGNPAGVRLKKKQKRRAKQEQRILKNLVKAETASKTTDKK